MEPESQIDGNITNPMVSRMKNFKDCKIATWVFDDEALMSITSGSDPLATDAGVLRTEYTDFTDSTREEDRVFITVVDEARRDYHAI